MRVLPGRGLTLVELVITISLAAIISIPAGILLSEHLTAALRARDYTVAMNLARAEMERLDSFNNFCHADLALGTTDPVSGYPAAYTVRRVVSCRTGDTTCNTCVLPPTTPLNADNGVKQIAVTVRKSGSTDTLASLTSYRTKYVLFGQ